MSDPYANCDRPKSELALSSLVRRVSSLIQRGAGLNKAGFTLFNAIRFIYGTKKVKKNAFIKYYIRAQS